MEDRRGFDAMNTCPPGTSARSTRNNAIFGNPDPTIL
jgi:hypothetical protein